MNDERSFERFVADHVAGQHGTIALPDDFYDDIHAFASSRRQRPRWLALIKEPPMRINSHLAVGSPTVRVAAILVATLLLAATLAAAGVAGHQLLAASGPIVVAQDGSGDYATIAEGVAAAADGGEVLVRPGTYEESVLVDKPVALRGDGDREAVVISVPLDGLDLELTRGSEDDPSDPLVSYTVPVGLRLAAQAIELSGMTISGPRPGAAIAVDAGTAVLSDLVIELAGTDADAPADPALAERIGVMVADDASIELTGSTLDAGVEIGSGANATIQDNVLTDGGIWAGTGSQLTASGNTLEQASLWGGGASAVIDGNTLTGGFIAVGGEGQYRVTGNSIEGMRYDVGPGVAIAIWDAGDVEVTGNTVTDSDTGIKTLFFGGQALIDGNTIESTRTGISVGGSGTLVSGNAIAGSDIIGLEVFNAGPTVTGNSITGGGTGLHLASPGVATVSGNTICDNTRNVRLVSGEMPDLSANDICPDAG